MMNIKLRLALAGFSTLLLTGCDLATKALAKARLSAAVPHPVIPGFWDMSYVENRDVGFSLLRAIPHHVRQPLIFVLVGAGLVLVLIYGMQRIHTSRALFGAVLVASGALGNLIDRAINGYVVDFVHWHIGPYSWPIFNIADVWVVAGVGVITWHEWFTLRGDTKTT